MEQILSIRILKFGINCRQKNRRIETKNVKTNTCHLKLKKVITKRIRQREHERTKNEQERLHSNLHFLEFRATHFSTPILRRD